MSIYIYVCIYIYIYIQIRLLICVLPKQCGNKRGFLGSGLKRVDHDGTAASTPRWLPASNFLQYRQP